MLLNTVHTLNLQLFVQKPTGNEPQNEKLQISNFVCNKKKK